MVGGGQSQVSILLTRVDEDAEDEPRLLQPSLEMVQTGQAPADFQLVEVWAAPSALGGTTGVMRLCWQDHPAHRFMCFGVASIIFFIVFSSVFFIYFESVCVGVEPTGSSEEEVQSPPTGFFFG